MQTGVARSYAQPIAWPSADAMFAGAYVVDWSRRLKYALRTLLTYQARGKLLKEVAASPCIGALFETRPRALYPVMNHLLDRRFRVAQRLQATQHSISTMDSVLGTASCLDLIKGSTL